MTESVRKTGLFWVVGAVLLLSFGAWTFLTDGGPEDDLSDVEIVDEGGAGGDARRSAQKTDASPAGGVIKGRLVGREGAPVAGQVSLTLKAAPGVHAGEMQPTTLEFRTDPDGVFSQPVSGYHLVKMVIVPEVGAPVKREFLKLAGEDADLGTITLAGGATLTGDVFDSDGDPVAGARVTVGQRASVADRNGVGTFIVGIDAETAKTATTAEDGCFRIDGVSPGRISVIVDADGFQPASRSNIMLDEGGTESVEFELEQPRTLTIEVREEAGGNPLPGARVEISALDYRPSDQVLRAYNARVINADARGMVRIKDLAFRRYRIRAFATGYLVSNDLVVDNDQAAVTVTLARCGEAFGRAYDSSSGKSVTGLIVTNSKLSRRHHGGDYEVLDADTCSSYFNVPADPGLFGIRNGQNDAVRLSFKADGYAQGTIELEALKSGERRRLDVALDPEGRISGRIMSHDYKALAGATVIARHIEDQSAADDAAEKAILEGKVESVDPLNGAARFLPAEEISVKTDDQGRFLLTGLAAGKYQLSASHSRQQDAAPSEYVVNAGATLEDVEIQLRPAGGVVGQIFGKNGRPVAAASVSLRTPTPAGASGGLANLVLTEEIMEVIADQNGRFSMTGIKPGNYSLLVTGPTVGPGEKESEEAVLLSIRIRPGVDLEKRIDTGI